MNIGNSSLTYEQQIALQYWLVEHKKMRSLAHSQYRPTDDVKIKTSKSMKKWHSENEHPNLGKPLSNNQKRYLSTIHEGKLLSINTRLKMSKAKQGALHPNWKGGKSFEPYCHRFNDELKESIRNRDNRFCILCGKSEILNGKRLSVHHIDGDKMQGCNGNKWHLCSLCNSCNSKSDTIEKEFLIVSNMIR